MIPNQITVVLIQKSSLWTKLAIAGIAGFLGFSAGVVMTAAAFQADEKQREAERLKDVRDVG